MAGQVPSPQGESSRRGDRGGEELSLAARGIEEFFRQRYGREAIYLPSGRLALYLAFREWLRPSDRILMSPVNDDVVFKSIVRRPKVAQNIIVAGIRGTIKEAVTQRHILGLVGPDLVGSGTLAVRTSD